MSLESPIAPDLMTKKAGIISALLRLRRGVACSAFAPYNYVN